VVRVTCPNDRRAVEVSLTPEGQAVLEKADADNARWLPHPKVFSEADAKLLSDLLDRLREAIRTNHPDFAKNREQGDIP
jgi:DNA-binding MarR family transcriptional regulator